MNPELKAQIERGHLNRLRNGQSVESVEGNPLCDKTLPQKVVPLPLWQDAVRAVPNGFLRSALFGAIAKGKRYSIEHEKLAALDGIDISYTGQRLDQGDLDVWESVLHAARLQGLGTQCSFTSYALLKLMGKGDGGKNRRLLKERLERLAASDVTVKQGSRHYKGRLVAGAHQDEETEQWVITLDTNLRPLFDYDQFTRVEWAVRRSLVGQPLAKWLHGFYATHSKPFPFRIETLRRLCGSDAKSVSDFAKTLRKALAAVASATVSRGQFFRYEIRGDLVHIEKQVKGAQEQALRLVKKPASATKPRS
jgi:hypothetical protein